VPRRDAGCRPGCASSAAASVGPRREPGEDGRHPALLALLAHCTEAAYRVSDAISGHYFTHSGEAKQSLGA